MLDTKYVGMEAALLAAGYVVVGMNNTLQNCYGNAQCTQDVAGVVQLYQDKLNLVPQSYVLAGGKPFVPVAFAFWSSYADTIVPRSQNTDRFAAMVTAAGGDVTVHTSTGGHLDPSNFDPAAVVAFFNAH